MILTLAVDFRQFVLMAFQSDTVTFFQQAVQWSAILFTALTGTAAARKKGMDYFGALVIASIICVGGGTIRDWLLGRPVFWLQTPVYLVTIAFVSIGGTFIERRGAKSKSFDTTITKPIEHVFGELSTVFKIIDALALGLWAYLGTNYALDSNVSPVLAPVMGVITAIFGGVLRDVLFARIPEQFLPGQFYAFASAIGAIAYTVFHQYNANETAGFFICLTVTFIVRMISVKFNIKTS